MKTVFFLGLMIFAIQAGAKGLNPAEARKCLDATHDADVSPPPSQPLGASEWSDEDGDYTFIDLSKAQPPRFLVTTDTKIYSLSAQDVGVSTENVVLTFPGNIPSIYLMRTRQGFSVDLHPARESVDFARLDLKSEVLSGKELNEIVQKEISRGQADYEAKLKTFQRSIENKGRHSVTNKDVNMTADVKAFDQAVQDSCTGITGSVEITNAIRAEHNSLEQEMSIVADLLGGTASGTTSTVLAGPRQATPPPAPAATATIF